MTVSKRLARAAAHLDPYGWRAGAIRVLANALLVLLAFEVVLMSWVAATIVAGSTMPVTPVELAFPLVAGFHLVRWAFVLPGLLPVLVGLEYITRRVAHARVLTAIVAFAPMGFWELTKTPGDFPSEFGAVLGVTAVLFAILARLPGRLEELDGGARLGPSAGRPDHGG